MKYLIADKINFIKFHFLILIKQYHENIWNTDFKNCYFNFTEKIKEKSIMKLVIIYKLFFNFNYNKKIFSCRDKLNFEKGINKIIDLCVYD